MPTLLITGANRGLGLEFVRQYAADGWDAIAACRNPAAAQELQALAQRHKNVRIEALEVTDPKSIAALAAKLKDAAIDILINNAGIASGLGVPFDPSHDDESQAFGSVDAEAWDRIMRVNTIAPAMVTQALMPQIRRGKKRKIVMISSRYGSIERMSGPDHMAYRASKSALNSAMHNIAMALEAEKIVVVSMHPGWVRTDMGGQGADIAAETSIEGMRQVIEGLTQKDSGRFINYDGTALPW